MELCPRMADSSEKRVAPLELFLDLVFVFALTQVTQLMSNQPTWTGLGQGLLVLAALWWAWGAYAWLTNYIAAEEDRERLLMFAVMGAFLVAALAVPNAFGAAALLFAAAFLDGSAQAFVWILALAIDFSGPYVFGVSGFRVAPAHFAERFSLIVIIALGESIVAIGAGLEGEIDAGVVA